MVALPTEVACNGTAAKQVQAALEAEKLTNAETKKTSTPVYRLRKVLGKQIRAYSMESEGAKKARTTNQSSYHGVQRVQERVDNKQELIPLSQC